MSSPITGQRRGPAGPTVYASQADGRWRQVLKLGADLLSSTLAAQTGTALHQQYLLILQTTQSLIEGEAFLWLTLPGEYAQPGDGLVSQLQHPTAWMQQAIDNRNPIISPDGLTAATPLVYCDEGDSAPTILGALQVARSSGPAFSAEDLSLLEGLALQSTIGIRAARQMAIGHWRVEQLGLVRQVAAQIASLRDLDELAPRITRLILETFDYYYVAIFTLEPGQESLRFRSSAGPRVNPPVSPGERHPHIISVQVGKGIIGHVVRTGHELLARDVTAEKRYTFEASLPETRSELALPLKIESRLVGVLDVQSNLPDDFNETDLLVLRALASHIAVAIEGAQMYLTLGHRAEQLTTLFEISSAISSVLDQDDMLQRVADLIKNRFGYPYVYLFTVHTGRREIFYEAGYGAHSAMLRDQIFSFGLDDPQGIIPWVARQVTTVLANDVRQEPHYRPSPLPPDETRAELTIPIAFSGEILGILDIQSEEIDAFSEEDRFLFEALAGHVAIALNNARSYRSEQFQRQVADSLREVAGLLTTDTELEDVLQVILQVLNRTLPCDQAAIWLIDRQLQVLDPPGCPPLRLAAVTGIDLDELCLEIGSSLPDASLAVQQSPGAFDQQAPAWSWLAEALYSDQSIIRTPDSPFEPLAALLNFPIDHSAIAAPLRIGEQQLGVLMLAHRTAKRYGSESRLMTATFAGYAAVAIENARLYEAAHEQAWVSTVLLEVARATQEINGVVDLLQTVTEITPTLAGVQACALYMRDENDAFIPAVASGLGAPQQAEFERWRFAPGEVPAFDRLVQEQAPSILAASPANAPLMSLRSNDRERGQAFEHRMILVPLISRGEVIGAFLIEYQGRSDNLYEAAEIESFSNEQMAIVQGIARQTALAIENLRLLKLQQEEAYVSVALLQVAQAIASNTDLNETLETIVRLAPILIGMKRAAIFLLDESQQIYRLVQAYGVMQQSQAIAFGEFPLLDSLRQHNSLLACPADSSPVEKIEVEQAWARLSAPDLHQVGDFLVLDESLLLVFPLMIQNELLGALVVEEAGPVPPDLSRFAISNRHRREKRLEIGLGISQQASLAIQNDRFQRDLVNRERLERELQLAHEIQRSLLPSELLAVPGWEVGVLWKTAREVGGDLYDLFELPDGNLGVVVADVADKGMPAALYMTHVHALLRALSQTIQSPAEVLERINEAMAGEADHGMFVTLFFGVLTPQTGRLVYANAGHNPPILLKAGLSSAVSLPKGEMALGVLRGQRVEQAELSLGVGDVLVLYTDGITEVFSPQGTMFGEGQLIQAITMQAIGTSKSRLPSHKRTATAILHRIEEKLALFSGDQPPADDLTLLILSRLPGDPQ